MRCAGTFRDNAPRVEPVEATIVDGELRIEPLDREAYPSGFVLRASSEAVIWSGDLIPPIEGATLGERRVAGLQQRFLPMIEPVQGKAGAWVLFGEAPVDSAFRPDDPVRFNAMLEQAKLPVRLASDESGPPEPNGGLLVLGLLLQLAVVMSVGGFLIGASGKLDAGWTVLATLAVIAGGVAALFGLQRWWIGTLMLRVSQRRRRRSAVDGSAQPQPPPLPGLGTLLVFVAAGLAAGLLILATATEPHRSLAFPIGGATVGLVIGTVWVGSSRLTPFERRSGRPR